MAWRLNVICLNDCYRMWCVLTVQLPANSCTFTALVTESAGEVRGPLAFRFTLNSGVRTSARVTVHTFKDIFSLPLVHSPKVSYWYIHFWQTYNQKTVSVDDANFPNFDFEHF